MQNLTVTRLHLTFSHFYTYKGWTFEWKKLAGWPWPVKKNWEPKCRAGAKFWNIFQEFYELSDDEQEQYRVF